MILDTLIDTWQLDLTDYDRWTLAGGSVVLLAIGVGWAIAKLNSKRLSGEREQPGETT